MVNLEPVDPDNLGIDGRKGIKHRGRVSYPILKMFLETEEYCVRLDRTDMQQSLMSLTSCLSSYVERHKMPIKVFTSGGELYLMRTDIDKEGNPIPNEEGDIEKEDAPVKSLDEMVNSGPTVAGNHRKE